MKVKKTILLWRIEQGSALVKNVSNSEPESNGRLAETITDRIFKGKNWRLELNVGVKKNLLSKKEDVVGCEKWHLDTRNEQRLGKKIYEN